MARKPKAIETPGDNVPAAAPAAATPARADDATIRERVRKLTTKEPAADLGMWGCHPILERDGDWVRVAHGWAKERN